jgi:hypothetical protein
MSGPSEPDPTTLPASPAGTGSGDSGATNAEGTADATLDAANAGQQRDTAGRYTAGKVPVSDPAIDAQIADVLRRLRAERPGATVADQLLMYEAASACRRVLEIDAWITRAGGPITANGRIRSVLRERHKWAIHLKRLLGMLNEGRRKGARL